MGFTINEGAINRKVSAFSKSAAGQKVVKEVLLAKIESGISLCKITGNPIDEAKMIEAANKMKSILIQHSTGLPSSVQAIVSNIGIGPLTKAGDGRYTITLGFQGNFTRPSLVPSKYGYVSNIVALFNNGYHASNQVIGEWHGQTVASRQERSGTHFVNQAVATFNSTCGAQYNATAEASGEYI